MLIFFVSLLMMYWLALENASRISSGLDARRYSPLVFFANVWINSKSADLVNAMPYILIPCSEASSARISRNHLALSASLALLPVSTIPSVMNKIDF